MSYDIYLCEPKNLDSVNFRSNIIQFHFSHNIAGGTYRCAGPSARHTYDDPLLEMAQRMPKCSEAWLNITYNYSNWFYKYIDKGKGIRWLYGKSGADTINKLEEAICNIMGECDSYVCDEKYKISRKVKLGGEVVNFEAVEGTYWEPSPVNVVNALQGLLSFVRIRPDGIWMGD